jgi:hypothetical protein
MRMIDSDIIDDLEQKGFSIEQIKRRVPGVRKQLLSNFVDIWIEMKKLNISKIISLFPFKYKTY